MAKTGLVMEGEITQALSNATFKVQLDNGLEIFCTVSGRMRQNFIRVMPGDSVEVEMSPYDLTKGRISKRLRQSNHTPMPTHKKNK